MRQYFTVRNLIALASALLIGAFGSGLWDVLFKPALVWIGSAVLNVTTLGIQSLIDGIYAEVAKGFYERASNATHTVIIILFVTLFVITPIAALITVSASRGSQNDPNKQETRSSRRKWFQTLFENLGRVVSGRFKSQCRSARFHSILTTGGFDEAEQSWALRIRRNASQLHVIARSRRD